MYRKDASVILMCIPLAIYNHVWGLPKSVPDKITFTVTTVPTEGIRKVALDTRTFNARWRSVNDMPPAAPYVATPLIKNEEPAGDNTPLPAPKKVVHNVDSPHKHADICQRHGRHKVMVGRYRWRCKR